MRLPSPLAAIIHAFCSPTARSNAGARTVGAKSVASGRRSHCLVLLPASRTARRLQPGSRTPAPVVRAEPGAPGPPSVLSPYVQADPIGDADPAYDVSSISVDYLDDSITLGIRTVAPEDPAGSALWVDGDLWFIVDFDTPARPLRMFILHQSIN